MSLPQNPAHEIRLLARSNTLSQPTSGLAPGNLQANLLILPSTFASDFHNLCTQNPIPCPLLAYSAQPGDFTNFTSCIPGIASENLAVDLDIRTDVPRYNVYVNGKLQDSGIPEIKNLWREEDHVAFLIGCSYSFESALENMGLVPPHVKFKRNVSMYRSFLPLSPSGVFSPGDVNMVVSMRLYRESQVQRVREVTRRFGVTHGEPVGWGWEGVERILGVGRDLDLPDWGDGPVDGEGKVVVRRKEEGEEEEDGYVPVFWGCGVTPQEAVTKARIPGVVIGHSPGHMLILDVRDEDILDK